MAEASSLPLLGKTAIITGASRGIGAAIALQVAKNGANVSFLSAIINGTWIGIKNTRTETYLGCPWIYI